MLTYLVTGAADIDPSHENIRLSGRSVRYGAEVSALASDELRVGMGYVVIAHGDEEGTVYWSSGEDERQWLWVGMQPAPAGARMYLYCCYAGPRLVGYLNACECFGHSDSVPAPADQARGIVLSYLDEVDKLMTGEEFSEERWRDQLSTFVGTKFSEELEDPSSILGPAFWLQLSKSLQ